MNPDILLASDGGYWNLSGLSEAGKKFVKEHSVPTPDSRVYERVSIGAGSYQQVLDAAAAAGLVGRGQRTTCNSASRAAQRPRGSKEDRRKPRRRAANSGRTTRPGVSRT